MKFKPTSRGGVLVELSPKEALLPTESREWDGGPLASFNLKKILVPMDFSDCSEKALQYALPFARQFGAEITLLHVTHHSGEYPEVIVVDTQTIRAAERNLETLMQKITRGGIAATAMLRVGNPAAEIVDTATQLGMDVIILSTHGRTGLARVFLGSTAERVVRHAPCPVLIVREKEHEFVTGARDLLMSIT